MFLPSGNIAMFHVRRGLVVRSETNNTVQTPPSYPSDFRSSQNRGVIFLFDSAREQRYWCHVSCLSFLYPKRYDRFHLVKISHFLTYDNILVSWPLENREVARLIFTTGLYRSAILYATPLHWRDLISPAAPIYLPSLCLRMELTSGVTKWNPVSRIHQRSLQLPSRKKKYHIYLPLHLCSEVWMISLSSNAM